MVKGLTLRGMPTTPTNQRIIHEVGALIGRHRLTQKELATAIGIGQQAMSQRMTGHTPFTIADLELISAYFDVPITSLFTAPESGGNIAPVNRSAASRNAPRGGFRTGRDLTVGEEMLVGVGIEGG